MGNEIENSLEVFADKGTAFYNLENISDLPYQYNLDDYFSQGFIDNVSEFKIEGNKIYQIEVSIGDRERPV